MGYNIILIIKADSSVRVCENFKVTLSKYLKIHWYDGSYPIAGIGDQIKML